MDKIKCDVLLPVDFHAPAVGLVSVSEELSILAEYGSGYWMPICALMAGEGARPLPSCFSFNQESLDALDERLEQTQKLEDIASGL